MSDYVSIKDSQSEIQRNSEEHSRSEAGGANAEVTRNGGSAGDGGSPGQPGRANQPWDSPGKNTGVGCHFLLQCMKVKSESEVSQSYPTLSNPMDCSPSGSSIHGIFQARVLEWGASAFSLVLLVVAFSLPAYCLLQGSKTFFFLD